MNKSQIARDFWREILDKNTIDLRNSDARNELVNSFLADPDNKKSGWKQRDKRFFRLSLDKIFRERGISSHQKGIKPVPQKSQQTAGSMRMNIQTDEKPKIPSGAIPKSKELKEHGQEATQQINPLAQQAAYYTAENVAIVFDTMFNLLNARYPECTKLTFEEKRNLGESWRPIFDKYLGDRGGIWVMPILATLPVLLVRVAQFNQAKKEQELKKDYFPDDKDKDKDNDNKWTDHLGGR